MNPFLQKLRPLAMAASTAGLIGSTLLAALPGDALAGVANGNGPACPITVTEAGSTTVYPALVQATSGYQSAQG
jgi:ABC-type phosphate transport system substrate-binding protein